MTTEELVPEDVGNISHPKRPEPLTTICMAELYAQFETIFLSGPIQSPCGHDIVIFDHHFFHMASVSITGVPRLFMRDEKAKIQALTQGYGLYEVGLPRARHLSSAYATMTEPVEVWEDNPVSQAKWVYVKEFDSKPYPFSVVLITMRPEEGGILVPVSSFPCRKTDIKKWRQGKLIYSKNTKAAQ
jgi:hypothetical protein